MDEYRWMTVDGDPKPYKTGRARGRRVLGDQGFEFLSLQRHLGVQEEELPPSPAIVVCNHGMLSWSFSCLFSWCFFFPFILWFFLSGARVLGLVLCSCSRMVMLFVLFSVAWIALEVYVFFPVIQARGKDVVISCIGFGLKCSMVQLQLRFFSFCSHVKQTQLGLEMRPYSSKIPSLWFCLFVAWSCDYLSAVAILEVCKDHETPMG